MSNGCAYLLLDDEALLRQCDVDAYRSHGPGGQKRNKTSSAVRLRHRPTGLMATGVEDRSQHVNKARALRRLRDTISREVRSPRTLDGYVPSEVLVGYVRGGQLRVSSRNPLYPRVVSEVLDVFVLCSLSVSDTAERLGLSTSQVVQFFVRDAKLWRWVSCMRSEAGLRALRA